MSTELDPVLAQIRAYAYQAYSIMEEHKDAIIDADLNMSAGALAAAFYLLSELHWLDYKQEDHRGD